MNIYTIDKDTSITLYSSTDIAREKKCSIEAVQKAAVRLGYTRPGKGKSWNFTTGQKIEIIDNIRLNKDV